MKIKKQDWTEAEEHLNNTINNYKELIGQSGVNTFPALSLVLLPLKQRYDKGERSNDLYDEMINVE